MKKRKIAVLADFPLHLLRGLKVTEQKRHYATWLPQIAEGWEKQKKCEIHWVILNSEAEQRVDIKQWNQMFHIMPTTTSCRASTLYRKDRITIGRVLNEIKPVMGKNGFLNLLKGCMCPEDVIISIMTIHECSMRDFFKRAFTILKEELSRSRNGSKSSTATYLGGNRTRTRRLRRRNRVSSYRRRQRTR